MPSLTEDGGAPARPECYLGPSGVDWRRATRGSEARAPGQGSWPAGELREAERRVGGARHGRAQSPARGVRAPHHGSAARRRRRHGGAGGPGSQGWRSPGVGAATCRSASRRPRPAAALGAVPRGARGSTPVRPRAPPLPLVASSAPSLAAVAGQRAPLLPGERAWPAQCVQVGRQTGRAGPATRREGRLGVSPPGAPSSPRELCLRLPAPASVRPRRLPACSSRLLLTPLPPLLPNVYSSPRGALAGALLPSRRGSATDPHSRPPSPFFSPPAPTEPKLALL